MNSANEIICDTHIVNQMLHDSFEREYNLVVGEHEKDMDKDVASHRNELKNLQQAS
jgi:hypothetical protein